MVAICLRQQGDEPTGNGQFSPARGACFVIEGAADGARDTTSRHAIWRDGDLSGVSSTDRSGGSASSAYADPLAIAQSDRSGSHTDRIHDGRVGGSQALRACQLVAWRSSV